MEPDNAASNDNQQPKPQQPPAGPYKPQTLSSSATQDTPVAKPETDGVVVSSDDKAQSTAVTPPPASAAPKKRRRLTKKAWIPALLVLLLGSGASAYYFGYYANPSVLYGQALTNTGKGYDKLVDYVDDQAQAKYKGGEADGTYKFDSGGFSTDGKINFKADDKNGQLTFDVGLAATRIEADMRFIESTGTTPDIYIKAGGIKGLGTVISSPELDTVVDPLNETWIVIDHTLLDNYANAGEAASDAKPPTREQIMDAAKAFGTVNKEYVFNTDESKAVMRVVKNVGAEEISGHNTYHYQVAFNKDNVKKYADAQKKAIKDSKLGAWIKANDYESDYDDMFDDIKDSADGIKSSDTFDLWAERDSRLVYKVRVPGDKNPAENFVDLGLDYKGDDKYPFFLSGQETVSDTKTKYTVVATVDTKQNRVALKMDVNASGNEGGKFSLDMTYKPSNQPVKIEKPASAKTLAQVMSELGLGDYYNLLTTPMGDDMSAETDSLTL